MQIEFLGTGGAGTIPKPGCTCRVCLQARKQGVPYSRSGPSLFIHGPDILFDTPEEIKEQLNRADIKNINVCFYSHWHPDHVMGRRVWEMNLDLYHWPPQQRQTDIYIPQQVAVDFRKWLCTWEHLTYLEKLKIVRLIELTDGESVTLAGVEILPFRLAQDYVYAFLIQKEDTRVLIVVDEIFGWEPPLQFQRVDLAIIPMGLVEVDYFTGKRRIAEDHPVLKKEATFQQSLNIARSLEAGRIIISHIEEMNGLSHDDLQAVAKQLQSQGLNVTFAYDTQIVEV